MKGGATVERSPRNVAKHGLGERSPSLFKWRQRRKLAGLPAGFPAAYRVQQAIVPVAHDLVADDLFRQDKKTRATDGAQ